jgi:hypothetical protein
MYQAIDLNKKNLYLLLLSIAIPLVALAMLFAYYYTQGHLPGKKRSAKATTIGYDSPIVISKGGTYSGNWESKDTEVAAVEIKTSEPVIIENSSIRGAGYLVKSWGHSANITIRNTKGYGLTPTPWFLYEKPRRFLIVNDFKHVVVENCYMENTAGIYIGDDYQGDSSPNNTIKIRYNEAKNIDGRIYDGWYRVQFVQFNFRNPIQHAEIAWNQIINEPDRSLVEDNINIYNSRGTAASPILIHNNYIQGAYPLPATSKDYSGGGILSDSPETDAETSTAHLRIYSNQLVGLGNYCIGIAGGNNIEVYDNRAIVSGMIDAQTPFNCWTSGIWAKDYYNTGSTFANSFYKNTLGVNGQNGGWRNEVMVEFEAVASVKDNHILQGSITRALEMQEYQLWQQKLRREKIEPGQVTAQSE